MQINHGFDPDQARALAIDKTMRAGLADSLSHLGLVAENQFTFDICEFNRLIAEMRSGLRFPPSVFALYYELVFAIVEERLSDAQAIVATMVCERPLETSSPELYSLDHPAIVPHMARYQRLVNSDPSTSFVFLPPSLEVAQNFKERFQRSWNVIEKALPALAGEIRALVAQIIIVVGAKGERKGLQFDGGSSFRSWGALFLNADSHPTELGLIEAIAHESAHCLLFGFCSEEPLVTNPDNDLFSSPLRTDLRPMDGIFHATYVSARMHWAVSGLVQEGVLKHDELAAATLSLQNSRKNFESGFSTVRDFGVLTPTGRALMERAHGYMQQRTVGGLQETIL